MVTLGRYKSCSDWGPWHVSLYDLKNNYIWSKRFLDDLQEIRLGPILIWRVRNHNADLNRLLLKLRNQLNEKSDINSHRW